LKFKNAWPKVVDFIISELNANVVFIPMQIPIDRDFAFELIENIQNKDRIKVITGEYTPQEIMGIIGQMDMVVGMRFHSLVLAAGMGVPMIGVIYLHKSNCFLKQIEMERFAVHIGDGILWENRDINPSGLIENIKKVWSNKETLKKEITDKVRELKRKELMNIKSCKILLEANNYGR